jgi:hypothetical protein
MRWLRIMVRLALATSFLYAATAKVMRHDTGLTPSTIFDDWCRSPFARVGLIGGEILLAIWLFSGVKASTATIVALAILSAFNGLVILELGKERPKPCGCTGTRSVVMDPSIIRTSLRIDLARNAFVMAAAGWLYLSARKRGYVDSAHSHPDFGKSVAIKNRRTIQSTNEMNV